MLLQQPVPLARVAGQHVQLEVEHRGGVDQKIGGNGLAKMVNPLERVDVVQMRDVGQRRGGVPLVGRVVWNRRAEAGVPHQFAGIFVIRHVVDRRGGQDDVGAHPSQELGDAPPTGIVVVNLQVEEFQAMVLGVDQAGGSGGLGSADRRDFQRAQLGTAAVPRRHRGDDQRAATLPQARQRSGTLEFDIIRVGVEGQNSWC